MEGEPEHAWVLLGEEPSDAPPAAPPGAASRQATREQSGTPNGASARAHREVTMNWSPGHDTIAAHIRSGLNNILSGIVLELPSVLQR